MLNWMSYSDLISTEVSLHAKSRHHVMRRDSGQDVQSSGGVHRLVTRWSSAGYPTLHGNYTFCRLTNERVLPENESNRLFFKKLNGCRDHFDLRGRAAQHGQLEPPRGALQQSQPERLGMDGGIVCGRRGGYRAHAGFTAPCPIRLTS